MLLEAVRLGDLAGVKRAIKRGARVSERDSAGVPALHYSAAGGHLEICGFLLNRGADIDEISDGGTPLMWATRCLQPRLAEFLLSKGARWNLRGEGGMFALACPFQPDLLVPDRQIECIRLLVRRGAQLNDQTDYGSTPLMQAAWYGNTEGAEELLRLGANPRLRDELDRSAAMVAFERGFDDLAKTLMEAYEAFERVED